MGPSSDFQTLSTSNSPIELHPIPGQIESGRTSTNRQTGTNQPRGGKYNRQGGDYFGAVSNWGGWASKHAARPRDLALSSHLQPLHRIATAFASDTRIIERTARSCLSSNYTLRLNLLCSSSDHALSRPCFICLRQLRTRAVSVPDSVPSLEGP